MSVATSAPTAPKKRKRGRESATDMVRSLGLVLLIVVPVWFLAQPPKSDEQSLRVVDPSSDVRSFSSAAPGVPVPGALPAGWRATSSTAEPGALRIGWVTPTNEYAEYDASTRPAAEFVPGSTGNGSRVGTFDVGGVAWQQFRDADGHTSLVREVGSDGVTVGSVVVGGLRETTTLEELRVLAAAVG